MKMIFRIFTTDFKRVFSNVVALVIIMGLSIIPALYAWFNILSNWDPYGKSATSKMHIAVYSEDEGVSFGKVTLNIGDTVVENLEANDTVGFVFVESREEALLGVYSGEYYAALIMPEDFSEEMISFLSKEPVNPVIEYYENSKKNAIATKITSKVKSTVQQEVNRAFVNTLAKVLSESGEMLTGENEEGIDILGGIIEELNEMDRQLTTYAAILNGFAIVTDSTGQLLTSADAVIPGVESMIGGTQSALSSMQGGVLAGTNTVDSIVSMMDISLSMITSDLSDLERRIELIKTGADTIDGVVGDFEKTDAIIENTLTILGGFAGTDAEYIKTLESYKKLEADLDTLSHDSSMTDEKLEVLTDQIIDEIEDCAKAISRIQLTFDHDVASNLDQSVYHVEMSLINAQQLLSGIDDSFSDVSIAIGGYANTLEAANEGLSKTRDYILDMQEGLRTVIDTLTRFHEDEQYQEIAKILTTDPEVIAEFVASPVSMETVTMYEIPNYGSAMSPFYTVLGLWVGALILTALVHVKVKKEGELLNAKPWQTYFGRYIAFFLIGQIQTLILVLGNLFFLQIDCVHPFRFYLAAVITSFVFTIFIYSLTVAFGNIGQALAVVIMVIQVAGAGCTFPIEVLPKVFQSIYRFLPFVYSMNALKECVGGMYRMDYWKDLGILMIYAVVSILVGVFLQKPFAWLNKKVDQSKAKSGLMV